jgi:hypothetical protein
MTANLDTDRLMADSRLSKRFKKLRKHNVSDFFRQALFLQPIFYLYTHPRLSDQPPKPPQPRSLKFLIPNSSTASHPQAIGSPCVRTKGLVTSPTFSTSPSSYKRIDSTKGLFVNIPARFRRREVRYVDMFSSLQNMS